MYSAVSSSPQVPTQNTEPLDFEDLLKVSKGKLTQFEQKICPWTKIFPSKYKLVPQISFILCIGFFPSNMGTGCFRKPVAIENLAMLFTAFVTLLKCCQKYIEETVS